MNRMNRKGIDDRGLKGSLLQERQPIKRMDIAEKVLSNGSSSMAGSSSSDDNNKEQEPAIGLRSSSSNNLTEQLVLLLLEQNLGPLRRNLDDFFLVVLALISYGLQMGFLFFEVGLVQKKNVTSVLFKSILDGYVGCLSYWLFGYALAWGDGNSFVGWNHFAFAYLPGEKLAFALYQMIFANTASTLVGGGMAERMHLPCYFSYGILQTGVAYPILSRWCWNQDGWLNVMGYSDISGSGVVHLYSGACGFVAAWVIGPRSGRFPYSTQGDPPQGPALPAHSLPLVNIGVMLLIFGFAGFNAASQLTISHPGDGFVVAQAAFNSFLACSSGGIASVLLSRFLPGFGRSWNYGNLVNGALSGMVAVCAGCGSLAPWAAFVTGSLGGLAFVCGRSVVNKLKVDDILDSFALHYSAGLVGLVTAPFLVPNGILLKADMDSTKTLGVNLLGVLVISGWAVVWCLPLFMGLKQLGVLRVPLETESAGLDVTEHSGQIAYHLSDSEDTADTASSTSARVSSSSSIPSISHKNSLDVNGLLDRLGKDQQQLAIRRRTATLFSRRRYYSSAVDIHPDVVYLP